MQDVWEWRWGRLALCARHYDVVINHTHLFGRWWWRTNSKEEEQARLEAIEEGRRAADELWWQEQLQELGTEHDAVQALILRLEQEGAIVPSEAPTEVTSCIGLEAYATKSPMGTVVIRPREI